MNNWIDAIMTLVLITNLVLLGSSRLAIYIRMVALQSLLLGLLPFFLHSRLVESVPTALHGHLLLRGIFMAMLLTGLKGIVLPLVLFYIFRKIKVYREIEPFVGYGFSLLIGSLVFAFAFWFSAELPVNIRVITPLMLPAGISTMFIGLFLTVSRKKAFTQMLGYLTFENGIYILGFALVGDVPFIVELGVTLDVFVAILLMSIAIHSINRQFAHTDSEKLDILKG